MREVCRWIFSNARSSHISVQCADEVALVDANCSRHRAASLFSDLSHETVTSLLPALFASMGVAAGVPGTIEGVADGVSSVASENCVDEFPSSQRRGGAKRRGGQFGEIQDVPV